MIAEATSVSGPSTAMKSRLGSAGASATMRREPGDGAGVSASGNACREPSATTTSVRSSSSRRRTSSCAAAMLPGRPKCEGTMPRTSSVPVRSAWTIANWSSASFLASVQTIRRRGGSTGECFNLFGDEVFADLFTDVGRRSVPPMIVAVVMVLQRIEGCSDREAVDRFSFDARWKYAAGGLAFDYPGFVHTVLVDMRDRLARSDRPDRIF